MASITGITAPTPVQENTSGSPITITNVQKDDFFLVIASVGGVSEQPNITVEGAPIEKLADTSAEPRYQRWVNGFYYWYWYPYYWYRYYWYYWPWYPHYWWGYWVTEKATIRVLWARAESNGSITFSSALHGTSLSRFTVYHFRVQTQASAGKVIDKVSWVSRPPQAHGGGNVWTKRAGANDLVLVVAAGKQGGTISATPSGGSPTNLVNYTFTHGSYARALVRLDWITTSAEVTYTYTNADISQFLIGYSVDLRERYVDFPTTGSVYWVAVPVRVKSSMERIYPKPLEQLIRQSTTLDPTGFGLEATFTKGNVVTTEDDSGHLSIDSYEELHIYRFPNTITVNQSVGDILLNDSELESYIEAQGEGWIA